MTPKEQFQVQGKRLATCLNRNGMSDLVDTAAENRHPGKRNTCAGQRKI